MKTMKKMRTMISYIQRQLGHRELVAAEVGVQRGIHAQNIVENLSLKRLVLVDIWDDLILWPYQSPVAPNRYRDEFLPEVKERVGHLPFVEIQQLRSAEASKLFPDNHFDFVYIDASHAYANVKLDCACWFPKVKKHGVIGGHDYFSHRGVQRAVNEFVIEHDLQLQAKRPDWWAVKL